MLNLIPDYRTAGALLLLTAVATAISAPARLMADADGTPIADALALAQNLAAAETARLETAEKLAAIGSASIAYGTGGVARLVGGLTLLAAGFYLRRAMGSYHPSAMAIVAVMLMASGVASAVSGAAAFTLAVLAPVPQASTVLTAGWVSSNEAKDALLTAGGLKVNRVEDALFSIRWLTGSLGFTLAGLALVALAPVQWRMGGLFRGIAVVDVVLGVAMLFIWVDAATALHRVTGVAFLIWMIAVGLWLAAGPARRIAPRLPSQ